MVRIDHESGLSPYLLKIQFKRWAKLWTVGNLHLKPLAQAGRDELVNITVGAIARSIPLPASLRGRVMRKVSYIRRTKAENRGGEAQRPDCFFLECYNPNGEGLSMTLTVKPREFEGAMRQFQSLIPLEPGYNRSRIPYKEINQAVDLANPFEVELVLNNSENTVLYFGLVDFVAERTVVPRVSEVERTAPISNESAKAKPVKCVVWDLDHTLWEGVLVEDGADRLRLKESVLRVIRELDSRGILNSVASKNNPDEAVAMLEKFGVAEYMLCPQISWGPKSQAVSRIAQQLNIGIDSLAFVDDQPFERAEVQTAHPEVAVFDACEHQEILSKPRFDVPVTDESRSRRAMYREQEQRQRVFESHPGDYFGFLRECRMNVEVRPLDETNLQRVYELAQRTNQLNFSGSRYEIADLERIKSDRNLETQVIKCSDRFGQYGIVGFAVIDLRERRLLDLMFSCRVQSKRVEHAVLAAMLKRFASEPGTAFFANYRKTKKNAPGGRVFDEMGFEIQQESEDGLRDLRFDGGNPVLDDGVVTFTQTMPEAVR
jgi:FkbH-like protein